MMRDVSTEELKKKKEDKAEAGEILTEEPDSGGYVTPHQGIEIGVTTRPTCTPVGLNQGSTAGGGARGIMTKKFAINDEEMLVEEERRLCFVALEVRHYEIMLKRAQVDSMKDEIDKL